MGTIEDKLNKLLDTKEDIKNAIVTQGQTVSDEDPFASYADKILAIQTGVQLPELSNPAAESQVLSGYEFIDETGGKKTGGIVSKSSSDLTVSGALVSTPAGYYPSNASKSVATTNIVEPVIGISPSGSILAVVNQLEAGYIEAQTVQSTIQLNTQEAKTVTPTTSEQTVVSSGVYTTGDIKVAAIPSVTQATPSISVSSAGLITASATQTAGYVAEGIQSTTKQLPTQATKTVTPSASTQVVVSSGVYTTGDVSVSGDSNLVASNIKSGTTIFGVAGTYVPVFA